jgi:hypothetical protein
LWFECDFASQTSIVNDGWSIGGRPHDCATAWDAWDRDRPDQTRSAYNAPASALPSPDERPILPRRVRLHLELERHDDVVRRARLRDPAEAEDTRIAVDEGERLPAPGSMVLIGEEWMEVLTVDGDRAGVKRGRRGTAARPHGAGATVHFGWVVQREVAVPLYREDWDL